LENSFFVFTVEVQGNCTAGGRIFEGIGEDVSQHLLQQFFIHLSVAVAAFMLKNDRVLVAVVELLLFYQLTAKFFEV
jgi:hypothetical protein